MAAGRHEHTEIGDRGRRQSCTAHNLNKVPTQRAAGPPQGEAIIVRYADDIVVGFQHKRDAEQYLRGLRERLTRFGLSLHPDKTRLVEFGRFAAVKRRQRGAGKPETFDFLGFTHQCTTTRRGRFRLGRKPVAKRVNRTLARIEEVLRKRWHHDIWEVGEWLGRVTKAG